MDTNKVVRKSINQRERQQQGDLTLAYVKNHTLHGVFLVRERARLEALTVMLERKQIRPIIEKVMELDRAKEAHERLDSGHGRGKIVLRVQAPSP